MAGWSIDMDVRSPLFQNIALIVAGVLFLNPIVATAAQLTVDQAAGGNTAVTQAQNGVPMVNIATPNGSGLSHNKFTDYNVGQQGLILNNSAQNLVKTQLGGYVVGNPNLKNGAAGLILNEVTGGNASQLKGYTEVAGRSAAVIVANPHGITCDGCGFINTPRVTLSTGTPIIENGRLQRFDVDGGQISIEGQGLNAGNVDQFDLITRSAQINAELHAKKLNIITGRNEVNATTLAATAKADDGSNKPMLAIDSSALGGMYAGAIRLVGTEQGVGVKLAGDMAASAGDIQIDANGKLSLNRVAASGDVALKANTIDLNADTYAGRNATLEAQQVEVRESLAAGQRLTVQAEQLNNAGIIEAGVRANGSVSSAGHLQLDGGKVRNAGEITSHGSMATDLQTLDNAGGKIATAGSATLKAEQLDNREGEILAQGNLTLATQVLDNRQGSALSGQALTIEADSVDNAAGTLAAGGSLQVEVSERLNNTAGLIEAGGQVSLQAGALDNRSGKFRALGSGGESRLAVDEQLNNQAGQIEIGSASLAVEAGSLINQDGLIRHVGAQALDMSLEQLGQAGGRIQTNAQLDLQADSWTNTTELQAGRITLDITDLTQTAGAALLARDNIEAKGSTWRNDGRIETDGSLSLELEDAYAGDGTLIAQGDLSVSAAAAELGTHAKWLAGGSSKLSVLGDLVSRGQMTAGTWLQLAAQNLRNSGTIGAAGQMSLQAADIRNEDGFLFSGASMLLVADRFTNQRGDLYSVGDLQFVANEEGDAPELFSNLSGVVESEGNITIRAKQITNAHEVENLIVSRKIAALFYNPDCTDCSGDKENVRYRLRQIDRTEATSDVRTASLLAGGDLTLSGQAINNRYSMLAANGAVRITGDTFTSVGAETGEYVSEGRATSEREKSQGWIHDHVRWFNSRNWPTGSASIVADLNNVLTNTLKGSFEHFGTTYTPDAEQNYAAIVQAGGDVTINATEIGNASIRPSFSFVNGGTRVDTDAPGSDIATFVTLNPQLPPDLQQKAVDPLSLPGFSLPSGQNGLFSLNTNPGHRYLIETNPAFANLGNFLNSDYMLGLLGFDPDEMQRRLGDGFYEQRLVREAVRARTGQRYLAGLDSDEAQFKYLMDNALASKEALNLSLGITLSAEQVAALTHDIVWMEEREVQGQKVLVPVLYLAQAEGRLAPSGALIQGRDVALISGGDLNNSGTLRATQNLSLTAQQNIANSGLMHAGERLSLLAGDSIRNTQGGILKGQDVSLVAVTGDVVNERTVSTHHSATRHTDRQQSFVDSAARIEAGNELLVSAGKDIRNIGGAISAGGDAGLQAGNDLILGSAEAENRQNRWDRKGHSYQTDITQYGSDVQVGGDLTAVAGRDLLVVGSTVKAGGDIGLGAGGDMTIASAANESSSDYYRKSGGKRVIAQEHHVKQVASVIEAGGNLDMRTDGNLVLAASQLKAGNEAYLYAGEQLALLAAQNSDYSLYDKKKKGGWGSKETQRDEVTTVRNVGSSITTGGNLSLISEGDQLYQKARLESGNDLILDSGGAITFEAVKDLDQESHEKSTNGFLWTSTKGEGKTDETLQQSVLIAKGETVINAVEGLRIDIKEINQKTVSQTIDAMVAADPELAWIKEAEKRGDVDWHRVKEIHDSFKYSHSGLGGGAMVIIAIVVTVLTAGAASALAGAVAQGLTTAGLATGTTAAAIGTGVGAFATAHAVQGAILLANDPSNPLGAFKESHSSKNLKNYAASGISAGIVAGVVTPNFSGTDASQKYTFGHDVGTFEGALGYTKQAAATAAVQASVNTAVNGGSYKDNLTGALSSQLQNTLQAIAFNAVGDYGHYKGWDDGGVNKTVLHAMVGGLLSEAAGGSFATGALAAGANEAMINQLNALAHGDEALLQMAAQLVGVAAAGVTGGDAQLGADIARSSATYNFLNHRDVEELENRLNECKSESECSEAKQWARERSAENQQRLNSCAANNNCDAIALEIQGGLDAMASLDGLSANAQVFVEAMQGTQQGELLTAQWNQAAVVSNAKRDEQLKELMDNPQKLKQALDQEAAELVTQNTEKALRDELARLESKLSTDAQLDAELKQLLNDREQFASSFAKVGEGAAMVGSLIEPDVWDLMSPAARLAKLADLLKFADKASGAGKLADEFADIKVLTQKLADLENGRLPSQTELAKYHDQTALAKAIQEANKRGLGGAKGILTPKDFPEVSTKISQRQNRHTAGTQQLEERGSVGFVNSVSDAQKVLDAYHAGQVKILGKNSQGFPVVKYEGVTGTNVNVGAGITGQPTNVFVIKGTKKPSIVPTNPNWSQK
jgi:filamentous hemagglutinin family protein